MFYQGDYPTAPLNSTTHAGFRVEVRVFMQSLSSHGHNANGQLVVKGSWGAAAAVVVSVPTAEHVETVTLLATSAQVDLWWPNGMSTFGRPALYNLSVSFEPASDGSMPTVHADAAAASSSSSRATAYPVPVATRRVGFRHFALVTGNDTNPEYIKNASGKQGTQNPALGMFWRINGAAIMSKGANMIPMDEMEGRLDADAHKIVVESAANAGLNTLRIWGGGMFLPDAWYDACDEHGIMVYHDMQVRTPPLDLHTFPHLCVCRVALLSPWTPCVSPGIGHMLLSVCKLIYL